VRVLYLDCFSGIAGDMLVGALLDLGVSLDTLRQRLSTLPLRGYSVTAKKTIRQGISGTKFDVKIGHQHEHRGWKEIREIIGGADLEEDVRDRSLAVFRRLIEAEARIHRVSAEKVHLHEVGAVDAIVDIVGSVIALRDVLGSDGKIRCSPLRLGQGMVEMEHGRFPVPPPAVAALLEGAPVLSGPVDGELVTPTGAALVSTLASGFGPMPPMTLRGVGYGAGTREYGDHPNMLRALLGDVAATKETLEEVVVIETTIDDMNPQGYGFLMERLFEAGALEVFYAPVQMKKNRPGTLVTVISPQERFGEITSAIFRESTTIGLRHTLAGRIELARELAVVKTSYGKVRVKVSSLEGRETQAQPEYEDCRRIAAAQGVPLKEIQSAALLAWRSRAPSEGVDSHERVTDTKRADRSRTPRDASGRNSAPASRREKRSFGRHGARKRGARRRG
jgi:uncharacterized protein (TIGR00299 family) protein